MTTKAKPIEDCTFDELADWYVNKCKTYTPVNRRAMRERIWHRMCYMEGQAKTMAKLEMTRRITPTIGEE